MSGGKDFSKVILKSDISPYLSTSDIKTANDTRGSERKIKNCLRKLTPYVPLPRYESPRSPLFPWPYRERASRPRQTAMRIKGTPVSSHCLCQNSPRFTFTLALEPLYNAETQPIILSLRPILFNTSLIKAQFTISRAFSASVDITTHGIYSGPFWAQCRIWIARIVLSLASRFFMKPVWSRWINFITWSCNLRANKFEKIFVSESRRDMGL